MSEISAAIGFNLIVAIDFNLLISIIIYKFIF